MDKLIKIVKSLEHSGLLLKGVTESVQNDLKEQKGGFLVGASLSVNRLTGKGIHIAGKGKGIHRVGKGIVRAGEGNKIDF